MAKARITVRPTGCLNGRPWPEVGEVVDLPDAVAEGMAKAGHVEVVKAAAKPKAEKRPAPRKGAETRKGGSDDGPDAS